MRVRPLLLVLPLACGGDPSSTGSGTETETEGGSATAPSGGPGTSAGTTGMSMTTEPTGGTSDTDGPADEYDEPYRSGSRLRARLFDGGDGAVVFVGWHDAELGGDCEFAQIEGAGLRCVIATYMAAQYADAGCSELVWVEPPCPTDAERVLVAGARSCGDTRPPTELFEIGDALPDGAVYAVDIAGDCVEVNPSASLRELLPADASAFVVGEERVVERDDLLGVRLVAGDDGSYSIVSPSDVQRGQDCHVYAQDPVRMCAPLDYAEPRTALHGDAACTDEGPLVDSTPEYGCPVEYGVVEGELHELGNPLSSADLYQGDTMNCTPLDSEVGPAWEVGPVLADGAFPSVTVGSAGTGRLSVTSLLTPQGALLMMGAVYEWTDTEYGLCYPRRTPDDDYVCAPIGGPLSDTWWADAGCTTTPLHGEAASALDRTGTFRRIYESPDCGERLVIGAARLGDVYTGSVYNLDTDTDTCTEVTKTSFTFYEVAEIVPASDLAPVSLRTE